MMMRGLCQQNANKPQYYLCAPRRICNITVVMSDRINYTPSDKVESAIADLIAQVTATTQVEISRHDALKFFVERGVDSWLAAQGNK